MTSAVKAVFHPSGLPPKKNRTDWVEVLAPLLDKPGEWARTKGYSKAATAYAAVDNFKRKRKPVRMPAPPEQFEYSVRELEGKHYLFIRFVGNRDAA